MVPRLMLVGQPLAMVAMCNAVDCEKPGDKSQYNKRHSLSFSIINHLSFYIFTVHIRLCPIEVRFCSNCRK
jgi:hypothetical protein